MHVDQKASMLDHALLNRQEELGLLKTATRDPDPKRRHRAADTLASHNMRLVESIARRYTAPPGMDQEDLFAEGLGGLHTAIQKFDVDRGLRFSTYATNWIRQAVARAVENSGHTIRVPSHMNQKIARAARAETELSAAGGNPPDKGLLAKRLGVREDEVYFYQQVRRECYSYIPMETPLFANGPTLAEGISSDSDPETGPPENSLPHLFDDLHADLEDLDAALDQLPKTQADLIRSRYGLDDTEPKTLRQLAEELGLSQERVRQKQLTATRHLYRTLTAARSRRASHPSPARSA